MKTVILKEKPYLSAHESPDNSIWLLVRGKASVMGSEELVTADQKDRCSCLV